MHLLRESFKVFIVNIEETFNMLRMHLEGISLQMHYFLKNILDGHRLENLWFANCSLPTANYL